LIELGVPVLGVAALVPVTIGEGAVPAQLKSKYRSMEENAQGPLVDYKLIRQLFEANGHHDDDPSFSVLLSLTIAKMPPTYIVTCGADVLRDDGLLLVNELRQNGIEVKHDHYPGYPHYFWATPGLMMNIKFRDNVISGIRFLLSSTP